MLHAAAYDRDRAAVTYEQTIRQRGLARDDERRPETGRRMREPHTLGPLIGYEETRRDHVDAAMLECRNEVVQLEREPLKRIDAELTRDVSQHRRAFTARLARRIRIHERRLDREAHTQTDLAGVRERQVVRVGRAAACRQHGDQYRGEEWPAGVASAAMPYVDASFHESSMRRCDSPFDAGRAPVRRVSGVSGPPCSRGIRPVRPGAGPWQVRGRTGCVNFN